MTTCQDDSYLDWFAGEFFLFAKVFSVFRIEGQPGRYAVSCYDGQSTSDVCEIEPGFDPVWKGKWQDATNSERNEIAAQARRVIKQPLTG